MTDPSPPPPNASPPSWRTVALVAVSVAAPLVLILAGHAAPGPALVAASTIGVLAALHFWGGSPKDPEPARPAVTPEPPPSLFKPPFAAMLDMLSDPILLIEGGMRENPS